MIAVFVIIALIALVMIGVCLFAVFKRCNARRQFRYESFTDVLTHSRNPSSTTSPLNASSREKDSSNAPRFSLFPFSFRQPKRASTPSIKSFFGGPQDMGSSTIPDVLPDIHRESPDSFFGGPMLHSQPF